MKNIFKAATFFFLIFSLTSHAQILSEPTENDNFNVFLDGLSPVINIQLQEKLNLHQGSADFEPWSGSYWPVHRGILANRYTDKNSPKSKNFSENYDYFQRRPPESYRTPEDIEKLSPAEKYDLLVGDSNWSLTKAMWKRGWDDFQKNGVVAGWTGICHGWAGATHMREPSPVVAVVVNDVTGTHPIKFYANDIKALLSWIWAESSPSSIKAGNRCRGNLEKDPYLRPLDPSCLDSNPMSWHLAMVNRVGISKNSLAMDSSSGPEVWNYPIASYDYSYFNPKTFETSHSLMMSIEALEKITADRFAAHRSPRAKYLVGVVMDVFHPSLVEPSTGNTRSIVNENETFIYDLELDEAYNVVGGEWYSPKTPDFIWTFPSGSRALTREDVMLMNEGAVWETAQSLPASIAEKGRSAGARGQVLSFITHALLNQSVVGDNTSTSKIVILK